MRDARLRAAFVLLLAFVLSGTRARDARAQSVTEFGTGIAANASPFAITAGPDGNLWFTEYSTHRIGRITPLGAVTEFSVGIVPGATPTGITAGPDGNLWFAEQVGNRIGRITPPAVGARRDALGHGVLDTRNPPGPLGAPALQAAGSPDRAFVAPGTCGIPADAVAISVNMTVTNERASGFFSIYRGAGDRRFHPGCERLFSMITAIPGITADQRRLTP